MSQYQVKPMNHLKHAQVKWSLFLLVCVILLAACNQQSAPTSEIRVELIDGNVRRSYVYESAISVDEFLRRIDARVGELDRVSPSRFAQIEDGMTITIVRVSEEVSCFDDEFPFDTRRIPTDALDPGVEEVLQSGENGTRQTCERCIFEGGIQTSCSVTSETVIKEAKEQIIYYGTGGVDVPIVVEGKLAYISNGQAWFIEGNVRNRRPITTEGRLDGRIFDLSPNGRQLLFSRSSEALDDPDFTNELWAILDTGDPEPVRLLPDNVISGGWYPGENFTVSYSTAEPRTGFPGWEAYNDNYVMRIDSQTGETLDFNDVVGVNAIGIYSYWGAKYVWSPDGQKLAWSRADSIGLVDLKNNGDFTTLITFPHFDPALVANWVWQPEIMWSQDSSMLISTVHGTPYGGESPINSVVFNIAVVDPDRGLIIDEAIPLAGIWAQPRYSPIQQDAAGFPEYRIAYLQARDPLNSLGGDYDLVVADRDGSNPKRVFPPEGRPGMRPFNEQQTSLFIWSPSGTHIAIIYQGNLWIVEVSTGLAQQITTDGQASHPIWRS
ncbi:MAG TPA: G5 domain-containing protein [Aggregatilineales bacterium]|nr:G5 domain-containing protein [Aggregatilineales bacterium]